MQHANVATNVHFLRYFKPDKYEEGLSLTISSGVEGARLTHNHNRHYNYVLQSLTLWREIADDMFRLWSLAEQDLIADDNRYVLKDTGQGLQRVQAAPRVLSAMRTILHNCQRNLGDWIGSSVIHLGDSNVPNAMLFVDKYTQVARILSPIIQTIREIDKLVKEDGIKTFIKTCMCFAIPCPRFCSVRASRGFPGHNPSARTPPAPTASTLTR